MEYPLISVIVPVYNVEAYLPLCMESIINQTYENLEIILVDDGSEDKCPAICDSYMLSDNRIVVIHKENGGLSDARNIALRNAHGEYVTCIDSDDYVALDYIESLWKLLRENQADISIVPFTSTSKTDIEFEYGISTLALLDTKDAINALLYQKYKGVGHSAWGKMIPKSYYSEISFPVDMNFEDYATTYFLLMRAFKIAIGKEKKYCYRIRTGSIIHSDFKEKDLDVLKVSDMVTECLCEYDKSLMSGAYNAKAVTYCKTLYNLMKTEKRNNFSYLHIKKEIIREIKAIGKSVIWDMHAKPKNKIKIIGIYLGEKVFKIIYSFSEISKRREK